MGLKHLPLYFVLAAALVNAGCASMGASQEARLANKTVVVTGASSGFGRGIATRLAASRANVVLVARSADALDELAREVGGNTLVVPADVGRSDDVARIARAAVDRFGRIDVWINNAGVGALGRFEDIPLEDQLRLVNVNVDGVIMGSYHALRQFRNQGSGTLINIGSVEGRVPVPYQATYVATKHAVVGLGAALNQELRLANLKNIHVVTVNPWATDTPFFVHAANYTGRSPRSILLDPPEKVVDAVIGAILKPGDPEIAVGYKAKTAQASERITRTVTEAATAALYHHAQMEEPPAAPLTSGILHEGAASGGANVSGGNAVRIAAEETSQTGEK
jgi:short-subunit dehydrogenase